MKTKTSILKMILVVIVVAVLACLCNAQLTTPTETVFYNFNSTNGFSHPTLGLVTAKVGSATSVYGIAPGDGVTNNGTVFQVDITNTVTVIGQIPLSPTTMAQPNGPLAFDASNNIYGTSFGASGTAGSVWEMVYNSSTGTWATPAVIFSFSSSIPANGVNPINGVVVDPTNNNVLYGQTIFGGGSSSCGVTYKLTHGSSWAESVLHTFATADGCGPFGPLALEYYVSAGSFQQAHLFGLATNGGTSNVGSFFEVIAPTSTSGPKFVKWHDFAGGTTDGANPTGALYFNVPGNVLVGTTSAGGNNTCSGGCGTVFALVPGFGTYKVIQFLGSTAGDVTVPQGGMVADNTGNMYFTGTKGGSTSGFGGVGLLTVNANPATDLSNFAVESTLFSFTNQSTEGSSPIAGIALNNGLLYLGNTNGGANSGGTLLNLTH